MAYVNISLDAFQPLVKWKPHQIDALCQTRGALHDTRHLPIPWLLACWYKHTHRDALKSPQLDGETIKICLVRFRVMGQAENFSTRACVCVCVSGLETQKDNIFFCFLYFYFVQMNQKRKKNKNLSSCNFFPLLKHTQVYPQNVQYKSNLYIYRILICILWIEMEKNVFFCFF